jgi:hypothetical protein
MDEAPAVLETISSRRPGYASFKRLKFSYQMSEKLMFGVDE